MQEHWPWIAALHGMRTSVLDTLTDTDLAFNPGGANPSLGQLFVQLGEVEHAYLKSLETFKQDFGYRNPDPSRATSTAALKGWLAELDIRLEATVAAFSDDDLNKPVERPGGNVMPVAMQLQVYMQAVFIFFGKAVVYLRAMEKPLPPFVEEYIG